MALVRGDGTLELRPAGMAPQGVGKFYVHGPSWEQRHTDEAFETRDETAENWRTLGGRLTIPANGERSLRYIQKFARADGGLTLDVDVQFREEARLQACSWALFWEVASLGGEELWLVDDGGTTHSVRLPRNLESMILWQGQVREIKLPGPMPLTLTVEPGMNLVIQDNREYSIPNFEFRFNFVQNGGVRMGERRAARFGLSFVEPTRLVLEEREATSVTDTSDWITWEMPWDAAPVDLSRLNEAPAGSHGFLGVINGRFVFADGTPARFWGTNMSGAANFPDKEQAPAIAARIAAYGINLVRVHHADAWWAPRSFIDYAKGDSRHFSAENTDRYHFFAAELRKRGIYIYLDQLVHRKFMPGDLVDAAEDLPPAGKPYALFDDRLIELQKEYGRYLWTTINPYTELAPRDDPQYVLMEYANEHDLFTQQVTLEPYRSRLEARYREWARENGLYVGNWTIDFSRPNDEIIRFFIAVQRDYYRRMRDFYRGELGVRIPMTGSNWARTTALLFTLQDVDFTEAHAYADHPWGDDQRVRNSRTTADRRNIFSNFAFNRLADKPFMAMEWDQSWPNEWRAELPLLAAAVAALQEWDGIGIYTYRHNVPPTGHIEAPFEAALDPARFGLFHHAALLYRRDVQPARRSVEVALDALRAGSRAAPAEWDKQEALTVTPELSRVAVRFHEQPEKVTDLPEPGATHVVVAPSTSLLPPAATSVRSDTGQLWRSWDIGYGTIDTAGTQAVYGTRGLLTKVELTDVTFDIQSAFATVALSSLSDDPITTSGDLLLTCIGRAENTGTVYNIFRTSLVEKGKSPMLLEPIRGRVTLRTSRTDLKAYALTPRGEILRELPLERRGGALVFPFGEPAITMHYRLTAEPLPAP